MMVDHDGVQCVPPYEVCLACGASWKGKPPVSPAPVLQADATEAVASCA